jgi:superfamily II DNA or RNA helicase
LSRCDEKVALLRDRLYVDEAYVTDEIREAYQSQYLTGFDPLSEMPLYETLYHYEQFSDQHDSSILAFNRGNLDKLRTVFSDFKILDERLSVPMKAPLKLRFPAGKTWKPYQPDAVLAMTSREDGILESPPRSGKTLMLAAATCLEREKTIVFAHQTDLLLQLFDTFEEFTNLSDLRTLRNPVVGFAESWADFETLDVVLCTKQTFDNLVNRPKAAIVQKMFGAVRLDEAHFLGADVYSKLINRFQARVKQGVTATPQRKDGRHIIVDSVLGGVFYKISAETVGHLKLHVSLINTGISTGKKVGYAESLRALVKNKARNRLILEWMKKDVEDGHTIVAVSDRVEHGIVLRDWLGEMGIRAEVFNGTLTDRNMRKALLNRIRSKEISVLIAMRSMTTGLDIPAADCFYNLLPSSNAVAEGEYEGGGGYEQQCTRVLTPFPGKSFGLCRDFVDTGDVGYSCLAARRKTYEKMGARVEHLFNPETINKYALDQGTAVNSTTF